VDKIWILFFKRAHIKQIYLQLGNRIRIFRKQKKYTIEDLADLADLHPTFLGQVERGDANASVTTLSKIAKALNKNVFDFFSPNRSIWGKS